MFGLKTPKLVCIGKKPQSSWEERASADDWSAPLAWHALLEMQKRRLRTGIDNLNC